MRAGVHPGWVTNLLKGQHRDEQPLTSLRSASLLYLSTQKTPHTGTRRTCKLKNIPRKAPASRQVQTHSLLANPTLLFSIDFFRTVVQNYKAEGALPVHDMVDGMTRDEEDGEHLHIKKVRVRIRMMTRVKVYKEKVR